MGSMLRPLAQFGKNKFAVDIIAFLLIALAVTGLYSRALNTGYQADDFQIFTALESSQFSFLDPFPVGTGTYFRPLTVLTLLFEHPFVIDEIGTIHHLSNVIVHAATGILVYLTCRLISSRPLLSLGLGLLFVTYPVAVTPIYRITDRSTLLLAFFYVTGVYCFIRFLKGGHLSWLLLAGAAVIGSLLAKEGGVTLVAVLGLFLLLYRFWLNVAGPSPTSRLKKALIALSAYSFLTIGYLVLIYQTIYSKSPYRVQVGGLVDIIRNLGAYFAFMLFPNNEAIFNLLYDEYRTYIMVGFIGIVVFILIAAGWLTKRAGFHRLLLLLLVLIVLLPILPQLLLSGVSSRQLYLSFACLCIAIACWWAVVRLPSVQWAYLLLPLIALAALVSYQQGNVRVANWQAYERYCESFRAIMATAPDDPSILIFTIPHSYHSAPILSNDGNGALYHCLNDRFGQFSRFKYVSPLLTYRQVPQQEIVTLDRSEPGTYSLSLISPDAYFLSEPRQQYRGESAGSSIRYESNQILGHGRSTGFKVEISDPGAFQGITTLYFDGLNFQQLLETE